MEKSVSLPENPATALGGPSPKQRFYRSLALLSDSESIRLLDLDAASDYKGDGAEASPATSLTCQLRVARLQDSPSFTALSYVWGDKATPSHKILCRPYGYELEITANCFAALCQIRRRFGAVTIWVDSICINQDDISEKENQIPLMGEIYTWAEQTYIWFGAGDELSDKAMDWLQKRANMMKPLPFTSVLATSEGEHTQEIARYRKMCLSMPLNRLRHASELRLLRGLNSQCDVYNLLNRNWAQRAWTFQEIILSAKPIILCGDKALSWDSFISAVYNLQVKHCLGGSKDEITTVLKRWRSIIDLWLKISRQYSRQGLVVRRQFESKPSFGEHMDDLSKFRLPFRLRLARNVICFVWALSFAGAWGYITYLVCSQIKNHPILDQTSQFWYIWLFWAIAWLIITLFYLSLAIIIWLLFWSSVLLGAPQKALLNRRHDLSKGRHMELSTIQVALHDRASSIPEDRIFALVGILISLGANISVPDYKRGLGETYRLFLGELMAWQPSALALVIDAESGGVTGTPSWVPFWGKKPTTHWLTSRYSIGSPNAAMQVLEDSYMISSTLNSNGRQLRLTGLNLGTVCFQTSLELLNPQSLSQILPQRLESMFSWIDFIHSRSKPRGLAYEVEVSVMYAILMGLTPIIRPRKKPGKRSYWPDWQAPCDFTEQKKDYKYFCKFYKRCLAWNMPAPARYSMIKNTPGEEYFLEIGKRIAVERRCLFSLSNGLVGSGSLHMLEGDEVFLLRGIQAPMVLRRGPAEGTYVVVGAALVHGLMHGIDERKPRKWGDVLLV